MPDSSIMLELCEILGITVNELLSGEEINMESYEKKADENLIALKKKDKNNMTKHVIISILFSATLLIGIMVCLICDIAISGNLTWSLIPVSSIVFVFAWIISFPSIFGGKRGFTVSLISLSVFIVPYLFLLGGLLKAKEVFSVGAVMAVVSIIFLWIIVAVFKCIERKLAALGTTFLSAIPLMIIVNVILSKMIEEPVLDAWDVLSVFMLLILAFVSFICDYAKKKGLMK